jgi:hypothetical protein
MIGLARHTRESSNRLLALRSCGRGREALLFAARGWTTKLAKAAFSPFDLSGCRSFSSNDVDDVDCNKQKDDLEVVLYQRGPGRNTVARSGFFFSCLHTTYWLWYGFSFLPLVNASEKVELFVDPMIGTVGLTMAVATQSLFIVYPTCLVDKLSWKPASGTLLVYNHTLPWVRPSTTPKVIPVGELSLDVGSKEAIQIIGQLGGNIGRFVGHLGVREKNQWPPYMLEIRDEWDVPEPAILLEALVSPGAMAAMAGSKKKKVAKRGR